VNEVLVATVGRIELSSYVSSLIDIYSLLLFGYILLGLLESIGVNLPQSKVTASIKRLLYDLCEPYLSIFRKFIPPFGPVDISPLVALISLQVVGGIFVALIHG